MSLGEYDASLVPLDGQSAALQTILETDSALTKAFTALGDMMTTSDKRPTIARIWRGRTTPERADEYEAYNYEAGIKPLIATALGVQTFREDRDHETEFITISYWENVDAMSDFTGSDPTQIHHLERDEEFLIELPQQVQVVRLLKSHGVTGY